MAMNRRRTLITSPLDWFLSANPLPYQPVVQVMSFRKQRVRHKSHPMNTGTYDRRCGPACGFESFTTGCYGSSKLNARRVFDAGLFPGQQQLCMAWSSTAM